MNIIKNIPVVILILILSTAEHCSAQDSTLFLTPKMFNNHQAIWLDNYNVWLYRNGNDTGWSKMNLNTPGWEHLSPMQISEKLADPNGKIEGWFRIKIKIDTSLATIPLYLSFQSGNAAANLYVDGKLFQSFGNINVNGAPFKSYTFYNSLKRIFRISLDKNNAHVIAIHFVSYLPTVPLRFLISPGDLGIRVGITGPKFLNVLNDIQTYNPRYSLFWISASATMALLFWLLAFQNRREKNLSLIALCSTFSCLTALVIYDIDNVNFLFGSILILVVLRVLLGFILCLLILFILARVFTNTISRRLIIIVLSLFILEIYSILSHSSLAQAIVYIAFFPAGLYYVISSWKRLKGAQWAIVVGFLCVLGFIVWAGVNIVRYGQPNYNVLSAIFLSFQISLLVYVSIRFREIIREVQNNAQKVVEITEEKRQQALNQQIILQQEVDKQTLDLRQTLQNLKSTQAQLIQQEKMASLGELTAGIAHEIQNPLNFVNNFSEVNTEMVYEAAEEADKGNYDEVKNILKDIKENSEKINLHGKRADGIVKSMLEHSRSSTGIKEPTNINKLADEYLRLAYHGLRAKDKSFNSEMKTDFDESIGKINIVPQDIGRVLLNLYNNAFYACTERSQSAVNQQKDGISNLYQPKVWVSTNKTENSVTITVKDNGGGIPEKVKEKIFQPFFTTKPTGSGTGLGLSLSYDIIKAHGGDITVESKEGEGSTFTIQLPLV